MNQYRSRFVSFHKKDHMHRLPILLLLLAISLGFASCVEEGPGGSSTITGTAAHHDDPIPDTKIYIRYGSLESPGSDPALYDDSTTASSTSATFSFSGLQKGDYYLYGIGFDSAIGQTVRAGIPVDLGSGEMVDVVVPVTE